MSQEEGGGFGGRGNGARARGLRLRGGTHLVRAPKPSLSRIPELRREAEARLARARVPFPSPDSSGFPPLLRAIYDPPPGLFLRGGGRERRPHSSRSRDRRRTCVLVVRRARSRGGSAESSPAQGSSSSAVSRAGSTAKRIAARSSSPAGSPSRSSVAASTATIQAAHRELAQRKSEPTGLVVSEYEPGVEPAPWRFPARNRIIAGLSAVTVVIEARERSGALITADMALEEGRDVLAVPGEITSPLSAGTNALLKLGATACARSRRTCSRCSAWPSRQRPKPRARP